MSNNSSQIGDLRALDVRRQPPAPERSAPPRSHSTGVLLRSLGIRAGGLGLDHLGMDEGSRARLVDALSWAQGIVLAAGPPGSGRTTTILAAVEHIRHERKTALSHEASAAELFVPEIRDSSTAELGMRGALADCLVLSTIRALDAALALRRLISFGMPPSLLASRLQAIVSQRLVRAVCPGCREEVAVNAAQFDSSLPLTQWKGSGCNRCGGTGYCGRTGIFDVFRMDPLFRSELARYTAPARALSALGLIASRLYEDGLRQVRAGVTTVEEVLRVAPVDGREVAD